MRRPLVFGDAEQIAAVTFLGLVADARRAARTCGHSMDDGFESYRRPGRQIEAHWYCDCLRYDPPVLRRALADELRECPHVRALAKRRRFIRWSTT